MSCWVVVVGAGMGGLTAALRLASRGLDVTLLEARSGPGAWRPDDVAAELLAFLAPTV